MSMDMSDQGASDYRRDTDQATLKEAPTNRSKASRGSLDITESNNSASNSRPFISSAGPSPPDEGNNGRAQNQHQPYVEDGYAELNPAYSQPGNVRPIWGLADPMPRIIRRGMKPSQQEIQADRPKPGEEDEDVLQPTDSQMEQGIGPKLNLNKLDKSIHDATKERERKYADKYGKKSEPPSEMGQESHTRPAGFLQQLTPPHEAGEDEEELSKASTRRSDTERQQQHSRSEDGHDEEKDEETNDDVAESTSVQRNEGISPINNIEGELHNHHTLWAVLRTKLREPLAEILAVFVLITIGICANVAHNLTNSGSSDSMAWSWGFATMIAIYISGGVSGGHLNPAITIMLYIFRGFPKRKIPVYILAQLLGAYIGSLVAYGIYRNCILNYLDSNPEQITNVYNSFVTNRMPGVADAASGFLTEFVAAAFIGVVVLALGDDSNAPPGAGMNAFIIGLVISIETMAFSASTGAAINPARDMGPRLALITVGFNRHDLFGDGWWIYGVWCANITGAIVGAILYDVAIFVGGESPLNYPRGSIKRVSSKTKARWRHRLRYRRR
ncbi:aquaporin-like protein, partial [Aureobasidium melanogenum]